MYTIQQFPVKIYLEREKNKLLVLDHIMGPERKIKSNRKSYLDAIKNYDPEEYRTLCHNCNQATMGGRVCPHQLQKEETMENLFKIREVNYG